MAFVLENLSFNEMFSFSCIWSYNPNTRMTAEWQHLIFNMGFLEGEKTKTPEKPNSAQPQPQKTVNLYHVSHCKKICNKVIAQV